MQLGDKIRIIRKARGLSQEGLGYSLSRVSKNGVSRQAVSDWETGKSEPCLDNIRDLADVLNVTFNALLDENIDLNDPDVLNAVLNKQQVVQYDYQEQNNITASIHYSINIRNVSVKTFKLTIASGVFAILGIIFGALIELKILDVVFPLLCGFFSLMAISLFIISLQNEIIPVVKNMKFKHAGQITYNFLSIDDEFIEIDGYENITNRLMIPINLVSEIKLGEKQKKTYGDIIVIVKDKQNPIKIMDVIDPKTMISTFSKIKKVLDNQ